MIRPGTDGQCGWSPDRFRERRGVGDEKTRVPEYFTVRVDDPAGLVLTDASAAGRVDRDRSLKIVNLAPCFFADVCKSRLDARE